MVFLTSHDLHKLPLEFILKHTKLIWADILWGYEHEFFYWFDVVKIAQIMFKDVEDFEEYDLASSLAKVDKSCVWKVSELIHKLAAFDNSDQENSRQKFLYLSLAWGYENRHKYEKPLDAVSYTFADFNCPDEISHFVPFLPETSGYDPSQHSQEENYQRLLDFWLEYLHRHGYNENMAASI